MGELKRCENDGCEPVEQTRGKMTPADYFDVHHNGSRDPLHDPENYMEEINDPDHANDMRIICKKCHRTTGWNKRDAPGMPGAGADYTRKRWNER